MDNAEALAGSRMETDQLTDDVAWNAVQLRDRAFDGLLCYGVRTTGIYCRPSCPSRRPKRDNVLFFESAEDAEHAGFRPCRRCEPRSETGTITERRLLRAVQYIDAHLDERITLAQLAGVAGLSPYHLQRVFTHRYGVSPRSYQDARRLARMKSDLRQGAHVGRAVWNAGYGSTRGAYRSAATGLGMTPATYRSRGSGLTIRFAFGTTRLGTVIVGWTDRGVCAVLLGDDQTRLLEELTAEFPRAELQPDRSSHAEWLGALIELLEGRVPRVGVPLDLQGTSFQLRVWRALHEIPAGEVRSYAEIARAIGAPTAARAVARACASNRTAIVVPCHRAVRSDGDTGGFRWGTDRKRDLLRMERE